MPVPYRCSIQPATFKPVGCLNHPHSSLTSGKPSSSIWWSGLIEQLEKLLMGTITVTLLTVLGEASARQVMKCYSRERKTLFEPRHQMPARDPCWTRVRTDQPGVFGFVASYAVSGKFVRGARTSERPRGDHCRPSALPRPHWQARARATECTLAPEAVSSSQPLDGEQASFKRKSLEPSTPKTQTLEEEMKTLHRSRTL